MKYIVVNYKNGAEIKSATDYLNKSSNPINIRLHKAILINNKDYYVQYLSIIRDVRSIMLRESIITIHVIPL